MLGDTAIIWACGVARIALGTNCTSPRAQMLRMGLIRDSFTLLKQNYDTRMAFDEYKHLVKQRLEVLEARRCAAISPSMVPRTVEELLTVPPMKEPTAQCAVDVTMIYMIHDIVDDAILFGPGYFDTEEEAKKFLEEHEWGRNYKPLAIVKGKVSR